MAGCSCQYRSTHLDVLLLFFVSFRIFSLVEGMYISMFKFQMPLVRIQNGTYKTLTLFTNLKQNHFQKYLTSLQITQFLFLASLLFVWLIVHWQNQPIGCSGM